MSFRPATRMAVVGIGNLIRTDDGFGLHALDRLRRDARVPEGVTFIDGGTHGLELLSYVSDCTHLLLLDAVDAGGPPGTVVRLANEQLHGLPGAASVHQVGLADLLATLPLVSTSQREIVLLGVTPLSTDWGTELTPPVAAALDDLVEQAIAQLAHWVGETSRERALAEARKALRD